MKNKNIIVMSTVIIIMLIAVIAICLSENNKGNNLKRVSGKDYSKVIEMGLMQNGAAKEDLLYEDSYNSDSIVLFIAHKAIGVAYVSYDDGNWVWNRMTPLFSINSQSSVLPPYTSVTTDLNLPDGTQYLLLMGKVYDKKISKLTICNNKIDAIISEKKEERYWFKIVKDVLLINQIKTYGENIKVVE